MRVGIPTEIKNNENRVAITVPGVFFDVNPGKRRSNARYQHFVRLSFGPEMAQLERGLDGLARLVAKQGSAAPHANGRAKVGAMR